MKKKNKLSHKTISSYTRKCPQCKTKLIYTTKHGFIKASDANSLCKKCAINNVERNSNTTKLEECGALQFNIKTNRWILTCPIGVLDRFNIQCNFCELCKFINFFKLCFDFKLLVKFYSDF
jgi:hypothetical protein